MMPNYFEYQKSIAQEFSNYENRVRYMIDDANWAEDGRYKEVLVMNYLRRIMPKNVSVGTGFVRNGDLITKQIDIIIYNNSFPLLFSEGDFLVCTGDCVLGIIEVKTRICSYDIANIVDTAFENAKIITQCNDPILCFNGVFSYNIEGNINNFQNYIRNFKRQIRDNKYESMVDHIALGNNNFIKLWDNNNSPNSNEQIHYDVYSMTDENEGLAYSYFFSNLMKVVYSRMSFRRAFLPNDFEQLLFPIVEGKMAHRTYTVMLDTPTNDL